MSKEMIDTLVILSNVGVAVTAIILSFVTYKESTASEHKHEERMQELANEREFIQNGQNWENIQKVLESAKDDDTLGTIAKKLRGRR